MDFKNVSIFVPHNEYSTFMEEWWQCLYQGVCYMTHIRFVSQHIFWALTVLPHDDGKA